MNSKNIKPILFSTEMVQAILAGRKTQTRRVVNMQAPNKECCLRIFKDHFGELRFDFINGKFCLTDSKKLKIQPGDILWVRETWVRLHEAYLQKLDPDPSSPHFFYWYKADGDPVHFEYYNESWKPSIHMPKEAARIFLKVTNVRVERLQDISEEDAIAEGVEQHSDYGSTGYMHYGRPEEALTDIDAVWSFETLWQSINGKKYPWDTNPWVWVYTFEQTEKPENFLKTN